MRLNLLLPFILIVFSIQLSLTAQDGSFNITVINGDNPDPNECIGSVDISATGNAGPFYLQIIGTNVPADLQIDDQGSFWNIENRLCQGTYTAVFNTNYGCSFERDFVIPECPEITVDQELLEKSITLPSHCTATDGSISFRFVNPFNDFPPGFERTLLNPEGEEVTPTFYGYENLSPGDYQFVITYVECIYSHNFTISEDEAIELDFVSDTPCIDDASGLIELYVYTTADSYSVLWTDGATDEIRENLTPGEYCVTVTDDRMCSVSDCYNLIGAGNELLDIQATIRNTCVEVKNGSIILQRPQYYSGPNTQLKYEWSNGETGLSIADLSPGEYCVTVTNGCDDSNSECFTVLSEEYSPISATLSSESTCPNSDGGRGSVSINELSGGSFLGKSITWDNGQTTSQINNLLSGNYCVTVSDNGGCVDDWVSCIEVGIVPTPQLTLLEITHCNDGLCENAVVEFVDQSGLNIISYNWHAYDPNSSDYFQTSTTNGRLEEIPFAGTYILSVIVPGSSCPAFTTRVEILDNCKNAPKIPEILEGQGAAIFPVSQGSPNGAIILSDEVTDDRLTYNWTGPNGFTHAGPTLGGGIVKPQGTYVLTVSNGCESQEFTFEITECEADFGLQHLEYCNSCTEEGYGILIFQIVNFDPNNTYFTLGLDLTSIVPIDASPTGVFGTLRYQQDQSGSRQFAIFDESFCSAITVVDIEVDDDSFIEFIPHINYRELSNGSFRPLTCNIATFCRTNAVQSGENCESLNSVGFRGTTAIAAVTVSSSPSGSGCVGAITCGNKTISLTGTSEDTQGFDGKYCFEGEICHLFGRTNDVVFRQTRGEEDLPIDIEVDAAQGLLERTLPEAVNTGATLTPELPCFYDLKCFGNSTPVDSGEGIASRNFFDKKTDREFDTYFQYLHPTAQGQSGIIGLHVTFCGNQVMSVLPDFGDGCVGCKLQGYAILDGISSKSYSNAMKIPFATLNYTESINSSEYESSIFGTGEVEKLYSYTKPNKGEIKLYPNPSSGNFTLDFSKTSILQSNEPIEIVIRDVEGRVVFSHSYSSDKIRVNMNLTDKPSGIYFIQVSTASLEVLHHLKMMKQ